MQLISRCGLQLFSRDVKYFFTFLTLMKIEKKCMLWACCYEDFVYYYKKWRVIKCDYKGNIIKQKYQKILDF